MNALKTFFHVVKPYLNKYVVTVVVFLVFLVFVDENNLVRRVAYAKTVRELKKEIRHYRRMSDDSQRRLERLHSSNSELERVAREDYLMKKANEEVFVVE
jgi:cell division protein FtsB